MSCDPVGDPLMKALAFELKRGYNAKTLHDLIDTPTRGAKPAYRAWCDHAGDVSRQSGSLGWAVIAKRDLREPLLITSVEFVNRLDHRLDLCDGTSPSLVWMGAKESNYQEIVAVTLDTFFRRVEPDDVRALVERVF
jgi:hypothetical protein